MRPAEHFVERRGKQCLLQFHEYIVIGAVHSVQNRVGRDQHRQIVRIDGKIKRTKAESLIVVNGNKPLLSQHFLLEVRQLQSIRGFFIEFGLGRVERKLLHVTALRRLVGQLLKRQIGILSEEIIKPLLLS